MYHIDTIRDEKLHLLSCTLLSFFNNARFASKHSFFLIASCIFFRPYVYYCEYFS